MSNEFAEQLKKSGNEAFAAKRYADAVVMYDKAIEADPHNYVYYNNRAAANHELKQYDEAIQDAQKALAVEENAKSHYRIGAALWAQKKLPEAKVEFEKAVGIEPSNANAKASIDLIDRAMSNYVRSATAAAARTGVPPGATMTVDGVVIPPALGGEFCTVDGGFVGIALDLVVGVLFVVFTVCQFLQPALSGMTWNLLMSATMAQQLAVMQHKGLIKKDMEVLSSWFHNFSSLLLGLCFFALLIGVKPQLLVGGFIGMYTMLDLTAHRAQLSASLGPLAGVVTPHLNKLGTNYERYVMTAASFESIFVFAIPLTGGTWFTLVYIQYVINRYKSDRYVQASFSSLRLNVMATAGRFFPAFMTRYLEKFCDLLYTVSQQSL